MCLYIIVYYTGLQPRPDEGALRGLRFAVEVRGEVLGCSNSNHNNSKNNTINNNKNNNNSNNNSNNNNNSNSNK